MSTERKYGNRTIERSFTLEDSLIVFSDWSSKKNYIYIDRWAEEPYRYVWINPKEKIIFSYCEGDLTKTICDDQTAFLEELRENNEFYKKFN